MSAVSITLSLPVWHHTWELVEQTNHQNETNINNKMDDFSITLFQRFTTPNVVFWKWNKQWLNF